MLLCSPACLTTPPVLPVADMFRMHVCQRTQEAPWLCSNGRDSWLFLHVLLKQGGLGWVLPHNKPLCCSEYQNYDDFCPACRLACTVNITMNDRVLLAILHVVVAELQHVSHTQQQSVAPHLPDLKASTQNNASRKTPSLGPRHPHCPASGTAYKAYLMTKPPSDGRQYKLAVRKAPCSTSCRKSNPC